MCLVLVPSLFVNCCFVEERLSFVDRTINVKEKGSSLNLTQGHYIVIQRRHRELENENNGERIGLRGAKAAHKSQAGDRGEGGRTIDCWNADVFLVVWGGGGERTVYCFFGSLCYDLFVFVVWCRLLLFCSCAHTRGTTTRPVSPLLCPIAPTCCMQCNLGVLAGGDVGHSCILFPH